MADFDDTVKASCSMLALADSDVDKMAALLYATPAIQSDENSPETLNQLFEAIGPSFLLKMLSGRLDIPVDDDDAVAIYRTTALNVVVSFCVNPDIAKNQDVLKMIPLVFELLRHSKEPTEIVGSAMQFFKCVIQHEQGRRALLSHNAIKDFAWMYSTLKSDDVLTLIDVLLCHDVIVEDTSCFNFLMTSLAEEFAQNQTSKKFTLCHHLMQILSLHKNAAVSDQRWPTLVLKGLKDILTSRIDDKQRVPALKLASAMIDIYGMAWAIDDKQPPQQQRQFQLILVHLSSIECRMQMEDQPISSILKNAELIIACFVILEKAVVDLIGENIDIREKDQIVQSYSDAAAAVTTTIAAVSEFEEAAQRHKIFIYAMIEFLCSGFAHDVLSADVDAYKYVPFITKVAENSFLEYQKWYDGGCHNEGPIDLFDFVIPAFQHFAGSKEGQKVVLDHIDVILGHLDFSWKVVEPAARESATGMSGSQLPDCARSAFSLLVKMTELMTDVILIEPETIKGIPQFSKLFSKVLEMLPVLENSSVFISLLSTASILALVLIKHDLAPFEPKDISIVLNGVVRFLKSYKPKMSTSDDSVFQAGDVTQCWVNIRELWLLGVHLLGGLVQSMPWTESHIHSLCPELLEDIRNQSVGDSTVP